MPTGADIEICPKYVKKKKDMMEWCVDYKLSVLKKTGGGCGGWIHMYINKVRVKGQGRFLKTYPLLYIVQKQFLLSIFIILHIFYTLYIKYILLFCIKCYVCFTFIIFK